MVVSNLITTRFRHETCVGLAYCVCFAACTQACQAIELDTLIPLRLGCRKLLLVGDPKQLPATVLSKVRLSISLYLFSFALFFSLIISYGT